MEQKDIKYTGITQATSDLDCNDGELSISHNMINHNGAMRPVILPNPEFTLKAGETLLYIHSASNYRNFIYQQANSIKAFTIANDARKEHDLSYNLKNGEAITKIESIGNTLILLTSSRLSYILWKEESYKFLGDTIPEVSISFGLKASPELRSLLGEQGKRYGTFNISFDGINEGDINKTFTDENKTKITNQVLPKVNQFIKEIATDKGAFIYPFFVRYALRMFDGNLIHHSAPILMIPTTKANPIVLWNRITGKGSYNSAELDIFTCPCTLDYQILSDITQLSDWSDIVNSIDIFISQPVYTYDQNGTCDSFYDTTNFDGYMIAKLTRGSTRPQPWNKYYQKWSFSHAYPIVGNGSAPKTTLSLPEIDKSEVNQKIRECSNFYFISSIKLDSDTSERTNVSIEPEYLKNLPLKERMTDDYQSHDRLIPEYSFTYNGRLNIANIQRELFNGFNSEAMSTYCDGDVRVSDGGYVDFSKTNRYICFVEINDGEKITVVNSTDVKLSKFGQYVFYPNPRATKMFISPIAEWIFNECYEINLEEHKGLNGAYYFSNFEELKLVNKSITATDNRIVFLPNKLYTSQVGNPFLFPLEGINTIGVGQIIGMSSTTRALSQGQFGQFPLLVFATDGIWAMEVSSNGLYSVKQPISRDVCSNPASITQIDGAVIFISSKGAMMVNAGEVNTFSAELDGPSFIPSSIIKLDEIATKESLTAEISGIIPVKDFLSGCQIAYDYPNARLLFINKDKPYAYVYSLESRSWATVTSSFIRVVSDYPHSYLQNNQEGVVNISSKMDYDDQSRVKSLILSRPIKFGDDIYKTVNQLINRGNFSADRINVVLFASTDGSTYFPIGSAIGPQLSRLQGSPYKYFRIAIIANFTAKESLSITSVAFTPKWRNKLR